MMEKKSKTVKSQKKSGEKSSPRAQIYCKFFQKSKKCEKLLLNDFSEDCIRLKQGCSLLVYQGKALNIPTAFSGGRKF